MVAELGFDRSLDLADFGEKNDFVKFLYHHAGSKLPQIATLASRRALGMFLCDCRKISASLDLLFEFLARFLSGYQNVTCTCSSHTHLLSVGV